MLYCKSAEVCRLVGIPYSLLISLLRHGKLAPLAKDSSGDFVWCDDDIVRLWKAVTHSRRKLQVELAHA
jgi:hypothetical protein